MSPSISVTQKGQGNTEYRRKSEIALSIFHLFRRLHLTWLLNSLNLLHLAASYRYLPRHEVPTYPSHGAKTGFHKYTVSVEEIPFHVLIVYSNLYCSGSLVRSKIVVTAASCLHTKKMRRPVVKVGSDTITGVG